MLNFRSWLRLQNYFNSEIFPLYITLHTYIHTYMHTYIHTYLHTYIPTYYIPTYIHNITYINAFNSCSAKINILVRYSYEGPTAHVVAVYSDSWVSIQWCILYSPPADVVCGNVLRPLFPASSRPSDHYVTLELMNYLLTCLTSQVSSPVVVVSLIFFYWFKGLRILFIDT